MPSRDTCSARTQDAGTSHESVNLKAPENFKSQTFVVFALVRWRSSSPYPGYYRPGAALDSKFHSVALNSPASEVVQRHLADLFKAKMQPVNKIITSMKRDKHLLMSSPMILLAVYRVEISLRYFCIPILTYFLFMFGHIQNFQNYIAQFIQ